MPPPVNNSSPLHMAVQAMFTKQTASNPDPEVIGEEQAILVSRVHEYSTLQEAKLSIQQNNRGAAKPRFIVISFITRRVDHKNHFYIRKGRVNTNGTAQVGRTWDMASFSKAEPYDPNLPLLIVSFQKPYFWVFDSAMDRRDFENVVNDVYRRTAARSRVEFQQNQLLEQQQQQQKAQQEQLQQKHLQSQQQLLEESIKKEKLEKAQQERMQSERIQQEKFRQEKAQRERIQQERVGYEERLRQEMAQKNRLEEERSYRERLQQETMQKERAQSEQREQQRLEQQQHRRDQINREKKPQEQLRESKAPAEKLEQSKNKALVDEKERDIRDQPSQSTSIPERSKPDPISVSSTHALPQLPPDLPETPPVPAVSRKRTVVRSRNLTDEDDELNQASMDAVSSTGAPTPPPHFSHQLSSSPSVKGSSSLSLSASSNSIPPLRPNIPNAQPKRASSRSYRQPLHPDETPTLTTTQASPSLSTPAKSFTRRSTASASDNQNDELNEDVRHLSLAPATKSLLEPSPSLERPYSSVRKQRDSMDHTIGDLEGVPNTSLSPLRSPQRTMKQSPSMNAILNSPMTQFPETRTEISDLFSVIQETKFSGDSLRDLENDVKLKLDSLSEQTFSNVTRADKYMAAIDKLVQSAISECESVDSKLQGIALELFGKSDDGRIKDLVQGSGANLNETRSRFGPGSMGKYGSDRNNDQVTTLKYRQLAADIEKLLDVSRLDDAFIKELTEFRFLPPNSTQSLNQVAFVERLLVDLSQALEMFSHRADSSGNNSLGDDSTTMQVFLEPKRTADDLAIKFGSQFQQFVDAQMKDLLDQENAATAFAQPFHRGLECRLLESFMPYASCMLFVKENVPNLHKNMLSVYERRVRAIYERGFSKLTRQWCLQLQKIVGERKELTINTTKVSNHSPSIGHSGPSTSVSSPNVTDAHTTLDQTYSPLPPQKLRELQAHYVRFVDEFSQRIAGQQIFIENFFFVGSESNIKLSKYVTSTPAQKRTNRLQRLLESIGKLEFSSIDASKSASWGIMNIMQNNIMPALSETINRTVITATIDHTISESSFLMMLLDLKTHEIRQTNQQYLAGLLDKSRKHLGELFEKFVGRRTRSILSSTFITKKRVGVHHRVVQFTKNVAVYEANISDALKLRRGQYLGDESRRLFDQCYANVFRALAQGLQVDSHTSNSLGATTAMGQSSGSTNNAMSTLAGTVGVGVGGNDEAKEKLNYHVVMVENLFQLIHDLKPLADGETNSPELQRIVAGANKYYERELNAYTADVVSRPLGKVMVFLSQHDSASGKNLRPKDTVSALKRAVKGTDAKELRVGIENLRKRVEKHFQGADRAVMDSVWENIKSEYLRLYTRLTHIAQSVDAMSYIDFTRSDIMRSM